MQHNGPSSRKVRHQKHTELSPKARRTTPGQFPSGSLSTTQRSAATAISPPLDQLGCSSSRKQSGHSFKYSERTGSRRAAHLQVLTELAPHAVCRLRAVVELLRGGRHVKPHEKTCRVVGGGVDCDNVAHHVVWCGVVWWWCGGGAPTVKEERQGPRSTTNSHHHCLSVRVRNAVRIKGSINSD
jgi:hypothetical protein